MGGSVGFGSRAFGLVLIPRRREWNLMVLMCEGLGTNH